MEIQKKPTLAEKQTFWAEQLPNFESKYWLPSHFDFLAFDMDQGNYVVKDDLDPIYEEDANEIFHRVNTGWAMWKKAINFSKSQLAGQKFFSHDFNGDGFQYHNTLQEAKKAAEADLDIYRDRVADGTHVADMGEFNELAYGIVVGQAEWSVDCVVGKDDHENGEYTQYEIGTEILSLYLSEAQEPSND